MAFMIINYFRKNNSIIVSDYASAFEVKGDNKNNLDDLNGMKLAIMSLPRIQKLFENETI